jgi:hypothetical protein
MASDSPIREGFRTAFRNPVIVLAEIAWRWAFGAAALALIGASFLAYLTTFTVTDVDALELRSHMRRFLVDAIGHILLGSGPLLLRIAAILAPAVFVLWVFIASVGRTATLNALLGRTDYIPVRPQFTLNFLRASVLFASFIAYIGALLLAGRAAATADDIRPSIFIVLFVIAGTAIAVIRSRLDWFLSVAAITAARAENDSLGAVNAAVHLFRRRIGIFVSAGAVFRAIHIVLFAVATVLVLLSLSIRSVIDVALIIAITLAYFALLDFLHVARLAAYVAIDEIDRRAPPAPTAVEPPPVFSPDVRTGIPDVLDQGCS